MATRSRPVSSAALAATPARRGAVRWSTVASGSLDPFQFLRAHAGEPRFLYWGPDGGLAAAGVAAEVTARGDNRFAEVRDAATRILGADASKTSSASHSGPRWVGGFSFETGATASASFPEARFVLPRETLEATAGQGWLTRIASDGPGPAAPRTNPRSPPAGAPEWVADPAPAEWSESVRRALEAIHRGQVEKVVLARSLRVVRSSAPDPVRIAQELFARSPQSRTFLFEPRPGSAFLGSSPELLVRRFAGRVETAAVAGSRPRGRDVADDLSLERALCASSKDAWEHELVARFLRQVLDRRGRPWHTLAERAVVKLSHVQHLETRFGSDAAPGEHVLDLAGAIHPTPAVGGAPRAPSLELLARLEGRARGWYAGPVGWFDAAGDGEFSVAIRSAILDGPEIRLHAGCGIVQGSDPMEEWEESRTKFQLLVDAVAAAGDRQ